MEQFWACPRFFFRFQGFSWGKRSFQYTNEEWGEAQDFGDQSELHGILRLCRFVVMEFTLRWCSVNLWYVFIYVYITYKHIRNNPSIYTFIFYIYIWVICCLLSKIYIYIVFNFRSFLKNSHLILWASDGRESWICWYQMRQYEMKWNGFN